MVKIPLPFATKTYFRKHHLQSLSSLSLSLLSSSSWFFYFSAKRWGRVGEGREPVVWWPPCGEDLAVILETPDPGSGDTNVDKTSLGPPHPPHLQPPPHHRGCVLTFNYKMNWIEIRIIRLRSLPTNNEFSMN